MKNLINPLLWFLLVLLYGIYRLYLLSRSDQKLKNCFKIILVGTAGIYFISIHPTVFLLAYPLEAKYLSKGPSKEIDTDYIVVLSGGVRTAGKNQDVAPSLETFNRTLHGISLFRTSDTKKLILSGGNGVPGVSTEAYSMLQIAKALGVDKEQILLEENSHNTHGQAQEVRKIIADKDASISLVTSGIHMIRSQNAFKSLFTEVRAQPTGLICDKYQWTLSQILPRSKNIFKVRSIIIEYVGNAWYFLAGYYR